MIPSPRLSPRVLADPSRRTTPRSRRRRARLRAVVLAATVLVTSLIGAPTARAWTWGDTLTTIYRPLPNLPAFARPGDAITVWANAGSGVSGWAAALRFGGLTVPLAPSGGGWQPSKARWELSFTVPDGTREEIYDLMLTSNGTAPDVAAHAVKVIPDYRAAYYFAQVSDTHLPEHTLSDQPGFNTADTSGMPDFAAVIGDLNVIAPEFVLHTGDLVNEGELESYLAMYEMSRAQQMFSRLYSPIFVISGNHDIGGWKATPPPDGTSRKNWWRQFGWPFLGNPPAGDPSHSQNFSFDYGLLHVIGLESYINNGSYDSYMTNIWGAQSMSSEQMNWLAADVGQPQLAGHTKLAFYHYDFGGTLANGQPAPNFSQFNNPAALGLDGVIWGHNHGVMEGNRTAKPFNLGLQAVIDGRRTFRIFRVSNGVISPGPMHHSGGTGSTPTDSLTVNWSDLNDGTRMRLTATVVNRYGEGWENARLRFVMVDHDSAYEATGGTVVQTIRDGGRVNVYVKCPLAPQSPTVVTVAPVAPLPPVAVEAVSAPGPWLEVPGLYRPGRGPFTLRFGLPREGRAAVDVVDVSGRRVARLFADAHRPSGEQTLTWTGTDDQGAPLRTGLYLVCLASDAGLLTRKLLVLN